jgi:hypothetical protein
MTLVTCHQVFQNVSQVGCCFGRWVFLHDTFEAMLRWARYEMRYSESGFWIHWYLTRQEKFEIFALLWRKVLNFWIFRNSEIFDFVKKKWRPNKVDLTVPSTEGKASPKKCENSARPGLVFGELSADRASTCPG